MAQPQMCPYCHREMKYCYPRSRGGFEGKCEWHGRVRVDGD